MLKSPVLSKQNPTILAIDTSCDETSAAVSIGTKLLSNIRFVQIHLHQEYGGVVPHVAKLAHQQKLPEVITEALAKAGKTMSDIDLIAVTYGPGLAIALEVGIAVAKELAAEYNLPILGMNHMEGHLLSAFGDEAELRLPALALLVSGKHTELVQVNAINNYVIIGETQDDAAGEAFDKCARMLGLPYPGGPLVSKLASEYEHRLQLSVLRGAVKTYLHGKSAENGELLYELPLPMLRSADLDLSYSGLKTAFKSLVQKVQGINPELSPSQQGELCVMLNAAITKTILTKMDTALTEYSFKEIWMGGGVAANAQLQQGISELAQKYNLQLRRPDDINLLVDNAGMIAIAAALKIAQCQHDGVEVSHWFTQENFEDLDREPGLGL